MQGKKRCLCLGLCAWTMVLLAQATTRADDWPQWFGPQRDGVWREKGILDKFPKGGPKELWRKPIGGGYTGPSVVGDHVYVMDWKQPAKEEEKKPAGNGPGVERVLCLSARTGELIWKHEYEANYKVDHPQGPRTTPLVHQGKVYTLGTMGDLLCLDALKGTVIWSRNFVKDYTARVPAWGWAASLLADGDRIVSLVGGEGSAVVAFDAKTGEEKWKSLTADEVCYSPPVIVEAAGKRQLLVWLDNSVNGLDPENGKPYWSVPYPADGKPKQRPAVSIVTPRVEGDRVLVSSFYHGSLMLQLGADKPGATELWRSKATNIDKGTDLHAISGTPIMGKDNIYGVCGMGELRCLKADTGERVWETYDATAKQQAAFANAFLIPQGDHTWIFNDLGDLIIAKLTPKGYEEIDRANLLKPTTLARGGRTVVWSHPAFANRCIFVRNDKEIACISLAES